MSMKVIQDVHTDNVQELAEIGRHSLNFIQKNRAKLQTLVDKMEEENKKKDNEDKKMEDVLKSFFHFAFNEIDRMNKRYAKTMATFIAGEAALAFEWNLVAFGLGEENHQHIHSFPFPVDFSKLITPDYPEEEASGGDRNAPRLTNKPAVAKRLKILREVTIANVDDFPTIDVKISALCDFARALVILRNLEAHPESFPSDDRTMTEIFRALSRPESVLPSLSFPGRDDAEKLFYLLAYVLRRDRQKSFTFVMMCEFFRVVLGNSSLLVKADHQTKFPNDRNAVIQVLQRNNARDLQLKTSSSSSSSSPSSSSSSSSALDAIQLTSFIYQDNKIQIQTRLALKMELTPTPLEISGVRRSRAHAQEILERSDQPSYEIKRYWWDVVCGLLRIPVMITSFFLTFALH